MSNHMKSNQIKSYEIESHQIKYNQIKSTLIELNYIIAISASHPITEIRRNKSIILYAHNIYLSIDAYQRVSSVLVSL